MLLTRLRAVVVTVACCLALLACSSGDDGGAEGGAPDRASFCDAVAEVDAQQAELGDLQVQAEEDVPAAKERVVGLLDALDTVVDEAPEGARAEADELGTVVTELRSEVEGVDSAIELSQVAGSLAELGVPIGNLDSVIVGECP